MSDADKRPTIVIVDPEDVEDLLRSGQFVTVRGFNTHIEQSCPLNWIQYEGRSSSTERTPE